MSDTTDMDRGEVRVQMIENVQDSIKSDRTSARDFRRLLDGRGGPGDPGNARPFLSGIEIGLQLAENEFANLPTEIMHGDAFPKAYDPREVGDETASQILETLVSEAHNENWGNVAANLDRLDERCDELQDGDRDE